MVVGARAARVHAARGRGFGGGAGGVGSCGAARGRDQQHSTHEYELTPRTRNVRLRREARFQSSVLVYFALFLAILGQINRFQQLFS